MGEPRHLPPAAEGEGYADCEGQDGSSASRGPQWAPTQEEANLEAFLMEGTRTGFDQGGGERSLPETRDQG